MKSTVKVVRYRLQSEFHILTLIYAYNLLQALFEIIDMQSFEFEKLQDPRKS